MFCTVGGHGAKSVRQSYQTNAGSRTGNCCVDKIAGHKHTGAIVHRDNNSWVLASLGFVDGNGIGQFQLLQLLKAILDPLSLVKLYGKKLGIFIHLPDDAHVSIENTGTLIHGDSVLIADFPLHLVIIFNLHYLIPYPVYGPPGFLFLFGFVRGVEMLLERLIQPFYPQNAFAHRSHNLNIKRLGMNIARKLLLEQGDGGAYNCLRVIPPDKQKIPAALSQIHWLPRMDLMGIDNNVTLCGLAENVCQLYYIEAAGINDIPKHIARTYAGKLIHVTYQNQPGSYVYRSKKGMHKTYIHHGHLINNNDICVQRIFLISVKMHPGRPPLTHSCSMYIRAVAAGYSGRNQLQHTVDRSGLISGSLRHTLGRPSCRGCQKYFHGFHLKVAYDGVDVEQGEIVALIGANGAGKTTTLHTITGLINAKAGKILYEGRDVTKIPGYKLVSMGVAHVPEGRRVFSTLTVLQNLRMGAYTRKDKAEMEATLKMIYQRFPRLEERKNQLAGTLSGGEQQMLAMGRALMSHPKMVVMDEPSMGLSPIYVNEIFDIIQKINEDGTTVLLVEQNAKKALSIAHKAYVLETGRIVLRGDARELMNNDQVKKAYLSE